MGAKNIKNCASRHKSMKLDMESVHDIRSRKPLRPIRWSFFLGILKTGMCLHMKKFSFSKVLMLYTVGKLIEN